MEEAQWRRCYAGEAWRRRRCAGLDPEASRMGGGGHPRWYMGTQAPDGGGRRWEAGAGSGAAVARGTAGSAAAAGETCPRSTIRERCGGASEQCFARGGRPRCRITAEQYFAGIRPAWTRREARFSLPNPALPGGIFRIKPALPTRPDPGYQTTNKQLSQVEVGMCEFAQATKHTLSVCRKVGGGW